MSLQTAFRCFFEEPETPASAPSQALRRTLSATTFHRGEYGTSAEDAVRGFGRGANHYIAAMSSYGTAALLLEIAKIIGQPLDITLGTYTLCLGADVGRLMIDPFQAGLYRSVRGVIDSKKQAESADSIRAIHSALGPAFDLKIAERGCHAKVVLAGNERWAVTIESSSTLLGKAQAEFYTIRDCRHLFDHHLGWIDRAMKHGSRPLSLEPTR